MDSTKIALAAVNQYLPIADIHLCQIHGITRFKYILP